MVFDRIKVLTDYKNDIETKQVALLRNNPVRVSGKPSKSFYSDERNKENHTEWALTQEKRRAGLAPAQY